jgi:hypothetical protein
VLSDAHRRLFTAAAEGKFRPQDGQVEVCEGIQGNA